MNLTKRLLDLGFTGILQAPAKRVQNPGFLHQSHAENEGKAKTLSVALVQARELLKFAILQAIQAEARLFPRGVLAQLPLPTQLSSQIGVGLDQFQLLFRGSLFYHLPHGRRQRPPI